MQGVKIVEQLDMSSACGQCSTQRQHSGTLSIEDNLRQMHDFLTDYMRDTAWEQ